jgi:hypothetical protein
MFLGKLAGERRRPITVMLSVAFDPDATAAGAGDGADAGFCVAGVGVGVVTMSLAPPITATTLLTGTVSPS